jgi:hypothetical protein
VSISRILDRRTDEGFENVERCIGNGESAGVGGGVRCAAAVHAAPGSSDRLSGLQCTMPAGARTGRRLLRLRATRRSPPGIGCGRRVRQGSGRGADDLERPVIAAHGGTVLRRRPGGAPVGMFSAWPYEEGVVQLNSGDLILAYTDGVIEAVNSFGEEWGLEGLQRAAAESHARSADDMVQAIFASLDAFTGGRQIDDATVVVLRVSPAH